MRKNILLDFVSPERSIPRYIIGTAILTVVVQILYDLVKEPWGITGAVILMIVLIVSVFLILWFDYRQFKKTTLIKLEDIDIEPHCGLILMISPGNSEVPLGAIKHHQDKLRHCWLIATKESLGTAIDLAAEIRKNWPNVSVHDAEENNLVNPDFTQSTWQRVEKIYTGAQELGLREEDIVADITGGPKPMTAGMAIACLPRNRPMQYLKTVRDESGNLLKGGDNVFLEISIKAAVP